MYNRMSDSSNEPAPAFSLEPIIQDMQRLSESLSRMNEFGRWIGSPKDDLGLRQRVAIDRDGSKQLMASLSARLQSAASKHLIVADDKLRFQKVCRQYNAVVQRFKNIAEDITRRERLNPISSPPPPSTVSAMDENSNNNSNNNNNNSNNDGNGDGDNDGDGGDGIVDSNKMINPKPTVMKRGSPAPYSSSSSSSNNGIVSSDRTLPDVLTMTTAETYRATERKIYEENAEDFKNIEQEIIDVHSLFLDMSKIVAEQGEDIQKIGENIAETAIMTEKAVEELDEAYKHKSNLRSKCCVCCKPCIALCNMCL